MRRLVASLVVLIAALVAPVHGQMRGGAPGGRGFVGRGSAGRGVVACCRRPVTSHGVIFRRPPVNGFSTNVFFTHSPFLPHRRFVHHRVVFPGFGFGLGYPYAYGYGYDSGYDSGYPVTANGYADSGYEEQLGSEIRDLREEIGQLRADLDEREAAQSQESESAPAKPGLATLLVFRDGRRLEAPNYIIVGPTIWVLSEHQAKQFPLADLDLDATVKTNNERGLEFRVPTGAVKK